MPNETAEQKRQRAQAQFQKAEQRGREAASIFEELKRKKEADAANMARLRALRLAKEAENTLPRTSPRVADEATVASRKPAHRKKSKPGPVTQL